MASPSLCLYQSDRKRQPTKCRQDFNRDEFFTGNPSPPGAVCEKNPGGIKKHDKGDGKNYGQAPADKNEIGQKADVHPFPPLILL